jgi:uncharacterized protein YndB with AHSA1/START domain
MSTNSHDWSRFTVRINVNAPVDKLYQAWVTREGIEQWFLRFSEYKKTDGAVRGNKEAVEKGDTYKWRWYGFPDSVTEEGTILDVNGRDFFKFSFGKAGICSVTIKQEQGETIVEMVQDNIPTDEHGMQYFYVGCKTGWTFYFANMKSIFEGGIDLRNKNEKLQDMLNS